jgi:hypothetical protein
MMNIYLLMGNNPKCTKEKALLNQEAICPILLEDE